MPEEVANSHFTLGEGMHACAVFCQTNSKNMSVPLQTIQLKAPQACRQERAGLQARDAFREQSWKHLRHASTFSVSQEDKPWPWMAQPPWHQGKSPAHHFCCPLGMWANYCRSG